MPKGSRKVLPLKWKGERYWFNKERERSYAEVAKIYDNKSSIKDIVKKEKEVFARFVFAPQTAKVMATVCDKCLVKMEKALNLYNKVF